MLEATWSSEIIIWLIWFHITIDWRTEYSVTSFLVILGTSDSQEIWLLSFHSNLIKVDRLIGVIFKSREVVSAIMIVVLFQNIGSHIDMLHSCNCLIVNRSIRRSHFMDVKILSMMLYFLLIIILVNWMTRMACIVLSLLASHVDSLILRNWSLDSLRLLILQS